MQMVTHVIPNLRKPLLGLTDVAKAPEVTIAAKANDGKLTLDVKALKLAPGDYGFILQSPAKMSFRRNADDVTAAETILIPGAFHLCRCRCRTPQKVFREFHFVTSVADIFYQSILCILGCI